MNRPPLSRSQLNWNMKYNELKAYLKEHHQLPDKKKPDNRGLLNWWKYNRRLAKKDLLPLDRFIKFQKLNEMRIVRCVDIDGRELKKEN